LPPLVLSFFVEGTDRFWNCFQSLMRDW
jgi:hypothetical protein